VAQDSITRKLRRIIRDGQLRRELCWLRAQETDDTESVAALERADPRLRARMESLLLETRPDRIEDPRERRREFARLWHRHFERA
jgi:hypothetical protein